MQCLARLQRVTVLYAPNTQEWGDVFALPVTRAMAGASGKLTFTLGLSVGLGLL